MRTVTFKSVYEQVLRAVGLDPTTAGLTADREEFFADLINNAVQDAWEFEFWPELTLCEERAYRATWAAGTAYTTDDEVYYATDGTFYKALTTTIGEVPSATPASWEAISVNKYLPYEPGDARPLGEVMGIWSKDPQQCANQAVELQYQVTALGVQITDSQAPAALVWVKYRLRPNQFTRVDWSGTGVYAAGDLVYYDSVGECFVATYDANMNQIWVKVDMPWIFQYAVIHGAAAGYLRQDGQRERAEREAGLADDKREEAWMKAMPQQGQSRRVAVVIG